MNKSEILTELHEMQRYETPIIAISDPDNNLYIKKEEVIPFSFGGNKCRIAANYFKEAIEGDHDVVITYGASSSNLCRVIANMASRYNMQCVIVSPQENYSPTPNSELVNLLGATIIKCPLNHVHDTINQVIAQYRINHNPYFIYGGGHGAQGTDSYRCVMDQIINYEILNDLKFDNIFITLATGTSMSGLIIQNEMKQYGKRIIGISIARELVRAKEIMDQALQTYNKEIANSIQPGSFEILGDYRLGGYGSYDSAILNLIKQEFITNGLNLDTTYTGKAFYGMKDYLKKHKISNKNILFIHTGGTPLFFRENCQYLNQNKS